jgi:predicted nucleic acid-binding protein
VIVLDASAAVEWLLGRPRADDIAARLADPDITLHAPHLLAVEVAQVLHRQLRMGAISASRGENALEDLAALDLQRHDHEPLLSRVWELRDNVTAYDAVYLALAEVLDATLLTMDAKLARAPGHNAQCYLIA